MTLKCLLKADNDCRQSNIRTEFKRQTVVANILVIPNECTLISIAYYNINVFIQIEVR